MNLLTCTPPSVSVTQRTPALFPRLGFGSWQVGSLPLVCLDTDMIQRAPPEEHCKARERRAASSALLLRAASGGGGGLSYSPSFPEGRPCWPPSCKDPELPFLVSRNQTSQPPLQVPLTQPAGLVQERTEEVCTPKHTCPRLSRVFSRQRF